MKAYFCGMIGSGKTTVGRPLAAELGLPFCDLDAEMDRRLGHSFHELVKHQGWLAFRELEYAICKDFARRPEGIFGLGGGTVRYEWNTDVLRGTGLTILLTASLQTLAARVAAADRPRVHAGTTLAEDLRLMWERHHPKYYAAADVVYRTEGKPVAQEVAELAAIVRRWHATGGGGKSVGGDR